jgi:hypothetical protein
MKPKKIYSLCSHGVLIDTGSSKELADKLGTSKELISNYARDGLKYKGQYSFQEAGLANDKTAAAMKWVEDWDRVRKQILKSGR